MTNLDSYGLFGYTTDHNKIHWKICGKHVVIRVILGSVVICIF